MICLCGHPYLSHESGECAETGCPCVKWEEVAEGPTYSESVNSDMTWDHPDTLHWSGTWTWDNPPVPTLTEPPVLGTVGDIAKKVYDPTWMDEMTVFEFGRGFTTFGELRKRNGWGTHG